jgi:hypothetical protein
MRSCRAEALAAVALLAAVPASASAQICHHGTIRGETIRWETRFYEQRRFVGALPDDVEIERVEGGALVTEGGRAVGVDQPDGASPTLLVLEQTIAGDRVALHPPLVHGLQRVVLAAGDHQLLAFAPERGGPLETYLGYHASAAIGESTRDRVDEVCGRARRGQSIYVEPEDWDDLAGSITRGEERRHLLLAVAAAILALFALGGAFAYRRLAVRAKLEHADAVIEKRFGDLSKGDA